MPALLCRASRRLLHALSVAQFAGRFPSASPTLPSLLPSPPRSDVICEYPLKDMLDFHKARGAEATILVTKARPAPRPASQPSPRQPASAATPTTSA